MLSKEMKIAIYRFPDLISSLAVRATSSSVSLFSVPNSSFGP